LDTTEKNIIQDDLRSTFASHDEFDHFNAQNCENAQAYKHAACQMQELCKSKGTSQEKGPINTKCNCQETLFLQNKTMRGN